MTPIKAIFLDIDGVLNCFNTDKRIRSKSRCGSFLGIDKDKTQRLATIVKETGAILILTSSWKIGWEPKGNYTVDKYDIYEEATNYHAKYLDNHLKKKGKLVITDKTRERNLNQRGMGIKAYLAQHPEIKDWIVIDDEVFYDFEHYKIFPHLVHTDPQFGLTDADVTAAIMMLNGKITGPYEASSIHYSKIENKTAGPSILI